MWHILNHLGIEFLNLKTKNILPELSAEYFQQDMFIKEFYIVVRPTDFEHLKKYRTSTLID